MHVALNGIQSSDHGHAFVQSCYSVIRASEWMLGAAGGVRKGEKVVAAGFKSLSGLYV